MNKRIEDKEKATSSDFSDYNKKKEDVNWRDIMVYIYEWQRVLLEAKGL